jgi:hypothetical protein
LIAAVLVSGGIKTAVLYFAAWSRVAMIAHYWCECCSPHYRRFDHGRDEPVEECSITRR